MTKLAFIGMVALLLAPQDRPESVRDALLFGGFEYQNYEAIADSGAAARWKQIRGRAAQAMSRLRPPPSHSGEMRMVWRKRQHYERLFYAVGVPHPTARDGNLWVAEETADFVSGMRPCYEWESFGECPHREAEFAEYWLKHFPHSSFAAFLPLFAGNRWTCAADGFEREKKTAKAADARKRAAERLKQAVASKDPLFALVAKQMIATPSCLTSPY